MSVRIKLNTITVQAVVPAFPQLALHSLAKSRSYTKPLLLESTEGSFTFLCPLSFTNYIFYMHHVILITCTHWMISDGWRMRESFTDAFLRAQDLSIPKYSKSGKEGKRPA